MKNIKDVILGSIIILSSIYIFTGDDVIEGFSLSKNVPYLARADTYIKVLAAILLVLGMILIIKSINFSRKPFKKIPFTLNLSKEIVLTMLLLVVYVLVIEKTGFFVSSIFLVFFITFLFRCREKRIKINQKNKVIKVSGTSMLYSITIVTILHQIFTRLLMVKLP